MGLNQYLRRAAAIPPRLLAQKMVAKLDREARAALQERRDGRRPTFADLAPAGLLMPDELRGPPEEVVRAHSDRIAALTAHYLEHRFDLLGSGWVRVEHGAECRGVEGHRYPAGAPVRADRGGAWLAERVTDANLTEARRIWMLVGTGYSPIDWHLDFKSGFRWREDTWYRHIRWGGEPGADVKVPWELARMQHLPHLAMAYLLAGRGDSGFAGPEVYRDEFRNQVLDFVATNPPRYGVNWNSTMEVAIRASNWVVAYRLLAAYGARFDAAFEATIARSLVEHGRHIVANLEWAPELRGNHYLANVVGLLFIAAHLPRSRTVDAWLAFAVQEVIAEVEYQFGEDGANFEASTSYHRLSAEMVAYATALILGLPGDRLTALREYDHRALRVRPRLRPAPLAHRSEPRADPSDQFPDSYRCRLERMAEFALHLTKPNGRVPQIGDNDSGRFVKISQNFSVMGAGAARERFLNLRDYDHLPDDAPFWVEEHLDHRHLISAIAALTDRADLEVAGGNPLERCMVQGLANGRVLAAAGRTRVPPRADRIGRGTEEDWAAIRARSDAVPAAARVAIPIPVPGAGLRSGLTHHAYPEFGVYIFRSDRLFLSVRCGPIGQNGVGGHAHNDQLGVELAVDGEDWIVDPGTYLYTPLPARRNEYRSVSAHFAPRVEGREPGRLNLGSFRLGDDARGTCLYFGRRGFAGRHVGFGAPVFRCVEIRDDMIFIVDFTESSTCLLMGTTVGPWGLPSSGTPRFSPGYGMILR